MAGIEEGAVFRGVNRAQVLYDKAMSKDTANRLIRKWALQGGLPEADRYSVHSLRASFVTILRGANVSDERISRQTHHNNLRTLRHPQVVFDE